MTLPKGELNQNQHTCSQKQMSKITTDWHPCQTTENIKTLLDNGQTMQVIHDSTAIIKDLQIKMVLMLKLRAAAYGREGRYEQELEDATTMILYAPDDATGYLYLGRRYTNLGYQKQAMDVIDKGLARVSQVHTHYDTLLQEKKQIEKRIDCRVDFFTRLPYDIVCRITDYVEESTIPRCSRVSRQWRQFILNRSALWRTIYTFGKMGRSERYEMQFPRDQLLPSISHHVETLVITPLLDESIVMRCLKLIKTHDFSSLQALRILCKKDVPGFYLAFCAALTRVSGTLKLLDISITNGGGIPNVSHILSICRNLTSLRFQAYIMDNGFVPFTFPHTTQLTKVELDTKEQITSVDLQKLLQSSPNLFWLSIVNCDTRDFYNTILKYATIKVLIVGRSFLLNWKESDPWFSAKTSDNSGLKAVSANPNTIGPGFVKLLGKNCATLRRLHVDQSTTYYLEEEKTLSQSDWRDLSTFDFDYITCFTLVRTMPDTTHRYLEKVLAHMPNLETLVLNGIVDSLSPNSFKAIANMPNLQGLKIDYCTFDCPDMYWFLELFSQRKSSALYSLQIQGGSMDETAMEISGQIKSLKYLNVTIDSMISRSSVVAYLKNVSQLPQLEDFYMNGTIDLVPEDLYLLAAIKSLKSVVLLGIRGITQQDVDDAFPLHVKTEFKSDEDVELEYIF